MGTRRVHAFTCGLSRVLFSSLSLPPFNNQTKGSVSRPATPATIRIIRWRVTWCLMDTNSLLALLGPVSPSLAAYHYLRSPTDNPASRCSRCGHVLVPGISNSRIVSSCATQRRKKARPSPNTPIVHCLRQSCATCGHVNNTLLSDFLAPRPYPAVTVTPPRTPGTDQCPPPDPPPLPSSHLRPTPQPSAQPPIKSRRSRPKHKAGLQEMLARNKERQHEAANRGTSGLTTFLHGL
jgi:hypothetical protein